MANNQGIIHACAIQGDGTSEALHGDDIAKVIKDEKLAWVHLDGNNPQSREWLKNEIKYLDHIIVDALLAEETRPRILDFDEGAMMILRGVNLNENSVPEITTRFWVCNTRRVFFCGL